MLLTLELCSSNLYRDTHVINGSGHISSLPAACVTGPEYALADRKRDSADG